MGFLGVVMNMNVMIVMGSKSDKPVGDKVVATLKKLGVNCEITVASAHRTPDAVERIAAREDIGVFIAIAGLSAALPGCVAARTLKPVIGVPVSGKVNMDSILSVVQMPPGIPVAAVGLDRGENAAILAAQILAVSNPEIARALATHRRDMAAKVMEDARTLEG